MFGTLQTAVHNWTQRYIYAVLRVLTRNWALSTFLVSKNKAVFYN